MINIFEDPKIYKKEIVEKIHIPSEKRKIFNGKSFARVSFTGLCKVGCPFCLYKSDDEKLGPPQEKYEFSDYGFDRFIEFLNKSNNGYLLVAGSGEPFEKQDYVMQTVSRAESDRIVIVTSGIWAKNYDQAEEIILELYKRLALRMNTIHIVLRLSVDKRRYRQTGFSVARNIISVFKKYFKQKENFELQIHTTLNDSTMDEIVEKLGNCKKANYETKSSGNGQAIEIIPEKYKLIFYDGYEIMVGTAKAFYSSLSTGISDTDKLSRVSPGFDFWFNYNGNISTWGSQSSDNLGNIYVDDYEKVIRNVYENIICYSLLDKGHSYFKNTVNEVSPRTMLRAKAINIRDYAPTILLEEIKLALYYAIMVIKDYLKEGKLTYDDISRLSSELLETINKSKKEIQELHKSSDYCILDQYADKKDFNLLEYVDLYSLIKSRN